MNKRAYVIGGGLGGIAMALRLRAKGYQVTLLERGEQLGGRARVFKQAGYVFDAGPTVITAPHLIYELFHLFNKDPADYINLIALDHWYRYVFADGSHFDYVADEAQLLANIAAIAPNDVAGFKQLLTLSEKIFAKGFTELADQPFFTLGSMLKQIPTLIKLGCYKSIYRVVAQHLSSDKLRRVFTTQPLLLGGNPMKITAIYLLILHLERQYGCHYSMGGTHALINGLEKLMHDVGIDIQYQQTVSQIEVKNNQITQIVTDNNTVIPCDLAVYNGDPAFAYHHLINKRHRRDWPDFRLNALKYSMGLCVLYFGTTKSYPNLGLHTISYGHAYQTLLHDLFDKKQLNDDLSIYLYRATAIDKSLAPDQCDSFYALVPVPNLQAGIDWSTAEGMITARIIELLEQRLLPGLSQHIATQKLITPHYFSQELLSQHGAGFSIQPLFTQSAYLRFHNKAKYINGLYFVGAGTHPGAGIPGVLSSAKLVDQVITA